MANGIEARYLTKVVASGKTLSDGSFKQELPEKMFYPNEDMWKAAVLRKISSEVTFQEAVPLSEEELKKIAREATWTCAYCQKGKGVNHIECMKQAGGILELKISRIWSDPRVQEMNKYRI